MSSQIPAQARAFTLVEIMVVTAVIAVVVAVGVSVAVRTADMIDGSQVQGAALDFLQRERNAHVNRGDETEGLLICLATAGGACTGAASGDELVAHRMPFPVGLPAPAGSELARQAFPRSNMTITTGFIVVDAFARSVSAAGAPLQSVLRIDTRTESGTITLEANATVTPSFDAPSTVIVAPHASDLGQRATTNPTPQALPNSFFRGRQVLLE